HTPDDLALLQALAHAFAPTLNAFADVSLQMFPYIKLAHDIRHDASWLRAILERIESESPKVSTGFPHEYYNDLLSCWHGMRRVIQKLDVYSSYHELSKRPARLLSDVLMPMLEQLAPVLQRRRITSFQIAHHGFADDQQILIDKELVA